jgi:hypothetical protein
LQNEDGHQRLRGIHNCRGFYDHSKPWVTHSSIQRHDVHRVLEWREQYKRPVVIDECGYEGNIPQGWGNLKPEEMVRRFWIGTMGGGYVGHGETYQHPEDLLWWSKGGVLHGTSPQRIAWLKKDGRGAAVRRVAADGRRATDVRAGQAGRLLPGLLPEAGDGRSSWPATGPTNWIGSIPGR